MSDKTILQQLQEKSEGAVMESIYEKINELFGAGNQLFAMEFPLRSINSSDYTYSTEDSYSTLTKPYPVQEAEFALSDQLFDVSPIVQGSNGEKLSTVYETALNNFVPKLDALKSFVNDQTNLREWLLAPIEVDMNGELKKVSRMALAKKLYGDFLDQRNTWYGERNSSYDSLKGKGDLDGYARWLSTQGLVEEEKLNNAYNDAVVRGHYHEVMTLLGFLNISSPAEVLESTKQKMRASIRRSMDGSSDVYPVQFQPSDWFKSLRPNISPKDLTMATDSLIADYKAKKARRASLQAKLLELGVIEISEEKRDELKTSIDECNEQLAAAEQQLIEIYGEGTVSAVRSAINIYKEINPAMNATDIAADLTSMDGKSTVNPDTKSKILDIIGDVAAEVVQSIAKTYQSQSDIIQKQKKLTDMQMAYSEAAVKDKRLQKLRIEEQIRAVQDDLDFLKPLVTGTVTEMGKTSAESKSAEDALMISSSTDKAEDDFMDVIIKCDEQGSFSANSSSSMASRSSTGIGGWFWSGMKQTSSSSATSGSSSTTLNKKLEIGFRAKKVAFNRGGWFNPNIFKLSKNYYRLTDSLISGGIRKAQVSNAKNQEALDNLTRYKPSGQPDYESYAFPAFPTGFVIAKDITIRIESSKDESESTKSYMETNESSGGGIFCFRTNKSFSESRSSESAYFGSSDKYFYIRIPGPQILGWFLEFTAEDNSTPYESLDPEMYAVTLKELTQDAMNSMPQTPQEPQKYND